MFRSESCLILQSSSTFSYSLPLLPHSSSSFRQFIRFFSGLPCNIFSSMFLYQILFYPLSSSIVHGWPTHSNSVWLYCSYYTFPLSSYFLMHNVLNNSIFADMNWLCCVFKHSFSVNKWRGLKPMILQHIWWRPFATILFFYYMCIDCYNIIIQCTRKLESQGMFFVEVIKWLCKPTRKIALEFTKGFKKNNLFYFDYSQNVWFPG